MNANRITRLTSVLAGSMLALTVSACGQGAADSEVSSGGAEEVRQSSGSEFSRVRYYGSLDELVKDSSLVVTGVAQSQKVTADITPDLDFTLTTFEVTSVVTVAAGLLPSEVQVPPIGQTIVVRQAGSDRQPTQEQPLLTEGETYLLALTSSGLPGDLASQYYITGITAGMYKADVAGRGGLPGFTAVAPTEGDTLPEVVTAPDLAG